VRAWHCIDGDELPGISLFLSINVRLRPVLTIYSDGGEQHPFTCPACACWRGFQMFQQASAQPTAHGWQTSASVVRLGNNAILVQKRAQCRA